MAQVLQTPRFRHDCDECTFIGRIGKADLWAHENETLILRTGDDGPDYASFPMDVVAQIANDDTFTTSIWGIAWNTWCAYQDDLATESVSET